ncbi:MAG: hypothetical protein IJR82_04775 [Bacilli bacterium]|nr:hypothetical protein [Bacilli bacterium]
MPNKEFVILEIIPTSSNPDNGSIIQLSALKIKNLQLLSRFDYRLNDEALPIKEMKSWIDYDKEAFVYVDNDKQILDAFIKWSNNLPIIVIDNIYTPKYLKNLDNKIEFIYDYLDLSYSEDLIEKIIDKYHLEPSNYIVDLLYEALMYHFQ